jgi:hypothetical protein
MEVQDGGSRDGRTQWGEERGWQRKTRKGLQVSGLWN